MSSLAPVEPRERVIALDILRGFALLAVVIGNLFEYSGRAFEGEPPGGSLDVIARWIIAIFVESKGQTLLCMLFGFGFAIQLLRADARGEPVMAMYIRRLVVLFAIGFLHVTLLWWGDVTWTYAVAGFGLLAFQRASNRTRVIAAAIFIVVPFAIMRLPGMWQRELEVIMPLPEFGASLQRMGSAIHAPSHAGLACAHLRFALVFEAQLWGWYYFWILGRFLLGYVAGKNRWFERDGVEHLPVFRRMLRWSIPAAVLGTALMVAEQLDVFPEKASAPIAIARAIVTQLDYLGMALVYVAAVVLLVQRPRWRRVLGVIAPVGRMPLTTYLTQSLVCTFVFYGWGLGWAGSVGAAGCLGFGIALFALQVAWSHAWLRYFQYGPVEWVWRSLVYLKRPAMRVR